MKSLNIIEIYENYIKKKTKIHFEFFEGKIHF